MEVDPAASMRCWAIEIELGGRAYEVPALPASDWWPILVSADPTTILDIVVSTPGGDVDLDAMLLEGKISGEELTVALTEALELVAGRSFHVAFVLAIVATQNWPVVGGELAKIGFRWDVQPLGSALDAIYAIVMEGLSKKEDRDKMTRLLENESLTSGSKGRTRNRDKVVTEFETLAGPKPTAGLRASGAPSDSARPKTRQRRQPLRQVDP